MSFLKKIIQKSRNVVGDVLQNCEVTKNVIENQNIIVNEADKIHNTNENQTERSEFSYKLDYIIDCINKCDFFGAPRVDKKYIAKFCELPSVNDILIYYRTWQEPDERIIDQVADHLGVNRDWLKFDENRALPFEATNNRIHIPVDILKLKDSDIVERYIFAIKDKHNRREIIVIRKFNELKYDFFPIGYIFYDAGSHGASASNLFQTYFFLRTLYRKELTSLDEAYFVEEEEFYDLLKGKIYPASIISTKRRTDILEEFIDLSDDESRKFRCCSNFGKEFIDAQELVIWEREERKRRGLYI